MRIAFSTVACPSWTLDEVAAFCEEINLSAVELRTFGSGASRFACDPFLTAPEKTRHLFAKGGCDVACLATSIGYEEPVTPPVLGDIFGGTHHSVKATQSAVHLAARLECPLVRVFAYEIPGRDSRASAIARICERLELAVATARNTGVRLALENAGGFLTAAAISELLDRVNSPLLGAAYSPSIARLAGEDPLDGLNVLGDRLLNVRLKDLKAGAACVLGDGELPTRPIVERLAQSGFEGLVTHEHDAAWISVGPAAADTRAVLRESAERIYRWAGEASGRSERARGGRGVVRA